MEERKKEKKENSTELQKPNVETEVYNNNLKMWLRGKKKLKSLSRFKSVKGGEGVGRKKEK